MAIHMSRSRPVSMNIGKKKRAWNLFFMAFPLMIVVFLFSYIPLFGWYLALIDYRPGFPIFENPFAGLKYFQMFFSSMDFARVMRNTLTFSLLHFFTLPLPMIFAILLNEMLSRKFQRLSQTVTTLPHFVSWVTVYSLAFAIFSTDGMLNQVLDAFGLNPQALLTDAGAVYIFQTCIGLWKGLGWQAIIYIAAITGLDQELYDAAVVDGAGRLKCAIYITIPGLLPTLIVLMVLSISNLVNNGMDQYFQFRNPIVYNNIETIELLTYRNGFQLFDYSYATAVGVFKSVVSVLLLIITNLAAKKIRGSTIM